MEDLRCGPRAVRLGEETDTAGCPLAGVGGRHHHVSMSWRFLNECGATPDPNTSLSQYNRMRAREITHIEWLRTMPYVRVWPLTTLDWISEKRPGVRF